MHNPVLLIAVAAVVTALLRFAPFWVFGENQATPQWLVRMGRLLPYAIMGMLVVYCLKDVTVTAAPFGLPEFLGCAGVAGLHIWKRSTLLSIGGGTLCYMLLIQFVF